MPNSFERADQPNEPENTDKSTDQGSSFEYNGKAMTADDVRTKMQNQDQHISTLEDENKTNRERVESLMAELEKAQSDKTAMEEVMDRLGSGDKRKPDADVKTDPKPVDEDKLAERAADAAFNRMTQEEQKRKIKSNQDYVSGILQEHYGEKVDEKVFSVTRELGYSDEEAFEEAGKRPQAFLKLIGLNSISSNKSPRISSGSVRTPQNEEKERKTYDVYGSTSTQSRMAAWESRVEEKLKQLGVNN